MLVSHHQKKKNTTWSNGHRKEEQTVHAMAEPPAQATSHETRQKK